MELDKAQAVRQWVESNPNLIEIQVEYQDGETRDFSIEEDEDESGAVVNRAEALQAMLGEVDWDQVVQVEGELVDGDKIELDLEDPDDEDEDDDEDDEDDDEDESATISVVDDEDEDDEDDDDDEDEDEDEED